MNNELLVSEQEITRLRARMLRREQVQEVLFVVAMVALVVIGFGAVLAILSALFRPTIIVERSSR